MALQEESSSSTDSFTAYDPSETLRSVEAVALFLSDAFASGETGYIAHALGIAARSQGMSEIARRTGLSREALYRSLAPSGNPSLKTLLALFEALGLQVSLAPARAAGA